MKFIVEVRPPMPEDLAGVADKLAEAFRISPAKAHTLLRRAPGPVTKPVSEREAGVVAGIFESAGLTVVTVGQAEADAAPAVEPEGTDAEAPSAQAAASADAVWSDDGGRVEVGGVDGGTGDGVPAEPPSAPDATLHPDGADVDAGGLDEVGQGRVGQGGVGQGGVGRDEFGLEASDGGALDAGGQGGVGQGGVGRDEIGLEARDGGALDEVALGAWSEAAAGGDARDGEAGDGEAGDLGAWEVGAEESGAIEVGVVEVDDGEADAVDLEAAEADAMDVDAMEVDDDPVAASSGTASASPDAGGFVEDTFGRGRHGAVPDVPFEGLEPLRDDGLEDDGLEDEALEDDVAELADPAHRASAEVAREAARGVGAPPLEADGGAAEASDAMARGDTAQAPVPPDAARDDLRAAAMDGEGARTGAAAMGAAASGTAAGAAVGAALGAASDGAARTDAVAAATAATSSSGSAAVFRTGTPELQRHGGTTEAELGMHARGASKREPARGGVRRRIAAVGILPALCTLLVMVGAAAFTLLPVLRQQQAEAAERTALAYAASIEGLRGGLPLTAPIVTGVLTDMAQRSQARLADRDVAFLVVTDGAGVPLAGWSGDRLGVVGLPPDVARAVAERAGVAAADATGAPAAAESIGRSLALSWRAVLAMLGLAEPGREVASAAIRDARGVVGAVVVGIEQAPLWSDTGRALATTLLLGLIPVLLAILAAIALARRVTRGLRYLLDAADRISRGDLEHEVRLDSKDELGQLARAVERMRVSLQEGLERLRRRR